MMFSHLPDFAGDPIFELSNRCLRDPRPGKINLTVGMYYDEAGRIPVLPSVLATQRLLLEAPQSSSYLPIEGLTAYRHAAQRLIFGRDSQALADGRIATIQSVGGTGALKIGAEFLHTAYPDSEIWISDPAWSNHFAVFEGAGIRTHRYPYVDARTGLPSFDSMLQAFEKIPAHGIVLLHGCCHNPSGADLTLPQWEALIQLFRQRQLIAFVDLAYQGFGDGVDEDAAAVRLLAQSGLAFLVASSFSKNFALYAERCGSLSVVCQDAAHTDRVTGQLAAAVRRTYSNPPAHGARVIATILDSPELAAQWRAEVDAMRGRILHMRALAHEQLAHKAPGYQADYLIRQKGMFSLTGLSRPQIISLREQHGVYLLDSGRLCIPGLNPGNIERFTDALVRVLADCPVTPG